MEVEVDVRELTKQIGLLQQHGENLDSITANFAQKLHFLVEEKFDQQVPGWPPLSPLTLRKRRKSRDPHMLQDSGDLVNSLQPASGPDFSEVFTNKAYARPHLEGLGVPKRDFFAIDIDQAVEDFADEILDAIGGPTQ